MCDKLNNILLLRNFKIRGHLFRSFSPKNTFLLLFFEREAAISSTSIKSLKKIRFMFLVKNQKTLISRTCMEKNSKYLFPWLFTTSCLRLFPFLCKVSFTNYNLSLSHWTTFLSCLLGKQQLLTIFIIDCFSKVLVQRPNKQFRPLKRACPII